MSIVHAFCARYLVYNVVDVLKQTAITAIKEVEKSACPVITCSQPLEVNSAIVRVLSTTARLL